METLDELKGKWARRHAPGKGYDMTTLSRVIRRRVHDHTRESMKYFWASFVLQLIVYALYGHLIVRFFNDISTVAFAFAGVAIFVPFTYTLLQKFKRMAVVTPDNNSANAVRQYITAQQQLLQSFFRFKLRYELILIPLSTIIGTLLVFRIYVPGGPFAYPVGVMVTIGITLASCYLAIRRENERGFRRPLAELNNLLEELRGDSDQSIA